MWSRQVFLLRRRARHLSGYVTGVSSTRKTEKITLLSPSQGTLYVGAMRGRDSASRGDFREFIWRLFVSKRISKWDPLAMTGTKEPGTSVGAVPFWFLQASLPGRVMTRNPQEVQKVSHDTEVTLWQLMGGGWWVEEPSRVRVKSMRMSSWEFQFKRA